MNRSTIGWIVAAAAAIGGAAFAYALLFAGGSAEPSTELTTPDLDSTTTADGEVTTTAGEDAMTTSSASSTTLQDRAEAVSYVIDSAQTTASFEINEVLRGEPRTVLGTTNQVAGQVRVDRDDLGTIQFSDIVVNARTFTTDSNRRDNAIRGPVILNSGSDEHEFITFVPTAVAGLDGIAAAVGETYQFMVTGDLTIKDTTDTVTFDVTVEMVDPSTINGTATADVLRSDFDIGIPSVPFVANVTDEVTLFLEFVATTA